eukprot:10086510-Alexandrium_andersonii.AAC.1
MGLVRRNVRFGIARVLWAACVLQTQRSEGYPAERLALRIALFQNASVCAAQLWDAKVSS